MSKSRNIADLLDSNGDVKSSSLDNVAALSIAATSVTGVQASAIAANTAKVSNVDHPLVETAVPAGAVFTDTNTVTTSASDLTSGTLADAIFPAVLPAISGVNLTDLPAAAGSTANFVASGTLPNGAPVVLKPDGTVEVVAEDGTPISENIPAGSAVLFANNVWSVETAFDTNTDDTFVVVYQDKNNANYGSAIVGTVSGTSITFGTPVVYNAAACIGHKIDFDPNTAGKFVITYGDKNNGNYGTVVVGTVSGTSISFGTPVVFNPINPWSYSLAFDPNTAGKFVIATGTGNHQGSVIAGTVSGTSISLGTIFVYNATYTNSFKIAFHPNIAGKFIITYMDGNNSNYGTVIAGTVSGNSFSFGAEYVFNQSNANVEVAFNPYNANTFILSYIDRDNGNRATATIGTISGTSLSLGNSISFGSEFVYNDGAFEADYANIAFDPNNENRFIISYHDDGNSARSTVIVGTISGTSISFETPVVLSSSQGGHDTRVVFVPNTSGKFIIVDKLNSGVGSAVVGQLASAPQPSNLTATNFLGISTATYTDTQTATIMLQGGVSTNQTGLILDSTYYVQPNGTLATTAGSPSVEVGKALSATSLFLNDHAISKVTGLQTALDGKVDDTQVLTNVPSGAVFTDTNTWRTITDSTSTTSSTVGASATAVKAAYDRSWPDTNTTYSVGDGGLTQKNFTTALNTKLDSIESSATADQTKADIDALGINATQVSGYTTAVVAALPASPDANTIYFVTG